MKISRLVPTVLLVLLLSGYLGLVLGSAPLLPERVATHFAANGQPDGWMSRSGYLNFIAGMGIGLPLFILAITFLSRFFPVSLVNVPHKEFWLAPGRREVAQEFLFDRSLWLACLMVLFFGALHYLTVVANRSEPVRLPSQLCFPVLLVFLAAIILWVIALYRRFPKPS
ncbi:MAG: DUF1648 domain-containing protein [Verrucomicrobia bacterium]|nr:DUF1648 domain-containing protein [Verrucomicrobiota bacterium]